MQKLLTQNYIKSGFPLTVLVMDPQEDVDFHEHEFWEIQFITGGKGLHYTQKSTSSVSEGDFFIIKPGAAHGYKNTENLSLINILYLPEELNYSEKNLLALPGYQFLFRVEPHMNSEDRSTVHFHMNTQQLQWAKSMVRRFLQELETKELGDIAMLTAVFYQFQIEVSRMATSSKLQVNPAHQLGSLLSYFQVNFSQEIYLDDCEKIVHMSKSTLCRNFQACFGLSPMEYLAKIRIDQAKELLITTNQPVTAIAFECGFNDSNYFSKIFRKSVGCTPKHFRAVLA